MTLKELRLRRLNNMSIDALDKLNGKLIGRGHGWITEERFDVAQILSAKLSLSLTDKNQWYLTDGN